MTKLQSIATTEDGSKTRTWGHSKSTGPGARFQVKPIVFDIGGRLSLQIHMHRAEHWIVVEGSATVPVEKIRQTLTTTNISKFRSARFAGLRTKPKSPNA